MIYLSPQHYFLQRLADSLPSLGADASNLQLLKQCCALPDDPTFTERDELLSMYLDAAERYIDDITGICYRSRNFRLSVDACFQHSQLTLRLPVRLVEEVVFTWLDNDGAFGILTPVTDYFLTGRNLSLLPENALLSLSVDEVPYPFSVIFTTVNVGHPLQKMAIFQLAAHYYKNPEARGIKELDLGSAFQATVDALKQSFL